jgi:hypothetical protein
MVLYIAPVCCPGVPDYSSSYWRYSS